MFANPLIPAHHCPLAINDITFVVAPVPSSCCWLANFGSVYLPAGVAKSV